MGIIMRNNVAYSGSGGSETVELSMAEYEAREAAGAIDSDTWYLIYDATDSYNAKKVVYDNAESGMTARTVQGAIDELNSNFGIIESRLDEIISSGVLETVTSASGTSSVRQVPNGGSNTVNVIFEKPFRNVPTISTSITSAYPDGGSYYNLTSYCTITVTNVTKNGFTVKGTLNKSGYIAKIDFEWSGYCE